MTALAVTIVGPPDAARAAAALVDAAPTPVVLSADDAPLLALDLPDVSGDIGAVRAILESAPDRLDWCVQPAANRRKALLVCDMDSTIIGCECIDELAREAGVGDAVAAVTERAMRGEIAFEDSLRERVAFLAGLGDEALARVYAERVRLNRGARALVATMQHHGAFAALVSGGFTYFTERVARDAGFDAHRANRLALEDGRLTGRVEEPPLGPNAKAEALVSYARSREIEPEGAMAVGDGANDLAMMALAGVSVAYKAKPAVLAAADGRIVSGDLRSALFFQGYRHDAFIEPDDSRAARRTGAA